MPRATIPPGDLRELVAYVREHRTGDAPFDVVLADRPPVEDRAKVAESVAAYAEAGLTWWLERGT